jgi:hypothetical protein
MIWSCYTTFPVMLKEGEVSGDSGCIKNWQTQLKKVFPKWNYIFWIIVNNLIELNQIFLVNFSIWTITKKISSFWSTLYIKGILWYLFSSLQYIIFIWGFFSKFLGLNTSVYIKNIYKIIFTQIYEYVVFLDCRKKQVIFENHFTIRICL